MGRRKLHFVMSATYPEFVTKNTIKPGQLDKKNIIGPVSLLTVGAHLWDNPLGVTRT